MGSETVPSLLHGISHILRAAEKVEKYSRLAILCYSHAYDEACRLDPTSSGSGVRQFKTQLRQILGHDKDPTLKSRVQEGDPDRMRSSYMQASEAVQNQADGAQISKDYETAKAVFEVLEAVYQMLGKDVDHQIMETHEILVQKMQLYIPYNILPHTENQVPEIRAAVHALQNVTYLLWPENYKKKQKDIFDWLQLMFGFQGDNVANQREHLSLLLANVQQRLPADQQSKLDKALEEVMAKLFKNYEDWCSYLGRKRVRMLLDRKREVQFKLLYTGLYLLIWGEAANLRLMPECLCYVYHKMARKLYQMLKKEVKPVIAKEENFLKEVVMPLYNLIAKEAERSENGKSKHSKWRNYDDLNEYFWSADCFALGWPMQVDSEFFGGEGARQDRLVGKINFVEIRSFSHLFRSFDRMWNFYILAFQAMVILAWNSSGELGVFRNVLSVFITASILMLVQALLDLMLGWKARHNMSKYVKLRYICKLLLSAAWVAVLPVTYASRPTLFFLAIVVYLSPNMLSAVLFLFPFIRLRLESSDSKVLMLLMWWSQPRLYFGSQMHESAFSIFKYTLFWVSLLATKLAFSFFMVIKPLVSPTKQIMSLKLPGDFFPEAKIIGAVIAVWAPIIFVYFMDTQIWYAIFSTIVGGIYGAFRHLGEIRTLAMLRVRFKYLPGAFNERLIPAEITEHEIPRKHEHWCFRTFSSNKDIEVARFSQLWNQIITSFREEDLINNREMDLLLVPYRTDEDIALIQWPLILLARKIPIALDMAKDSNGKEEFMRKIFEDTSMVCAVRECYASFKSIIMPMMQGDAEKPVITKIFADVDHHIKKGDLVAKYKMSALPSLYPHFVKLMECLMENKQADRDQVVNCLQAMWEVVTRDIMDTSVLESILGGSTHEDIASLEQHSELFASSGAIGFPIEPVTEAWKEKIKRFYLLLTVNESAMDVPSNSDAKRRLTFFSNSLLMDMPPAPKVLNMISFSVLTPYYKEEVLFSLLDLDSQNEDGVSILFYLQKIFPDEWQNFLERANCKSEEGLRNSEELVEELRLWASYRGQTLTRTVRGMMYYRKALEFQAFLDTANGEDLMEGYKDFELNNEENSQKERSRCQAVADMKFTYVVSCQQYGIDKRSGNPRAQDILKLMTTYPSLRVAYVDELEEPSKDGSRKTTKVYYSVLVKAALPKSSNSKDQDQVIYRIKLPGQPILGEGKPENQNHALIFTRGEALQTIDMNQDNYMEEALKIRNLLQEFQIKHGGVRFPTILGIREHIFTGSVSSLACLMSNQDMSFVTICQRLLANPLKVRFHYGHPDVFDRLFHLTRGGVSKASKVINLSEDIFAGFNSTLRGGNVTHHEYIQVGKGRDVGLNQISMFEAKIANGNGEQTLSRDIYRLGHCFDFFRMLSCYFTTIGFYISTLITVLTLYVFLYGRLYLVLSGTEAALNDKQIFWNGKPLQVALVQIGLLLGLPMLMEICLEKGVQAVFGELILMLLQLAPVFFTFSLGTKAHYYGRTLLHGGAKYRSTGRGFVIFHAKFADNYRLYSRSHFVKGIELLIVLIFIECGETYTRTGVDIFMTMSLWLMVGTWLFAPFLFNPSGFEWQKIVDDWTDWNKWMSNQGGIGVPSEKSWESWWEEEQEHLRHSGVRGRVVEILLSTRFFLYEYGLAHYLRITNVFAEDTPVYVFSWALPLFMLAIFLYLIIPPLLHLPRGHIKRQVLPRDPALRFYASVCRVCMVAVPVIVILGNGMTLRHVVVFIIAYMAKGWGFLQIAQALIPVEVGFWSSMFLDVVRAAARVYEIVIGLLIFAPVACLAWFPFVSELQTRMLFNQAFSRGLHISRIIGGHR